MHVVRRRRHRRADYQARFSSDKVHGNHNDTGAFWDALYDSGHGSCHGRP
ncbi:MAG: hypothetical protein LC792_19590 [Actinobacteria bacterium]|nr:hypothetical protein [Actinomycetota bacterium]